jgi:GDP-4-dehydro-6-deoxy-D-mannose reductase
MGLRRILVTGAGGFVGAHLRVALTVAFPEAEVIATARDARADLYSLDVTDRSAVDLLVQTVAPDVCIHLAAVTAIPAALHQPDLAWQVNLSGTLSLARAIRVFAPACVLVYASSSDIYGSSFESGLPVDETAVLAPRNTYAATKAAADLALGAMCNDGVKAIRLRLFNHTGRGQTSAFVIAAFARQIARIERGVQTTPLLVGALDPRRDFLDVRDVCAAYVMCLHHLSELSPGLVLNIASGIPRRVGDVLADMLRLSGVEAQVEAEGTRLRTADIATAAGDASRARRLLGWEPSVPWETTLTDVLNDWRLRVAAQD